MKSRTIWLLLMAAPLCFTIGSVTVCLNLRVSISPRYDPQMADWTKKSLDPALWVESITDLLVSAYRVEANLIGVQDFPPLHRTQADILASQSDFQGVLEGGERLLAVVETEPRDSVLQIASLCVSPQRFRGGLASGLVAGVLADAQVSGRPVVVTTARANGPALALYQKFGFQMTAARRSPEGIELIDLEKR